MPAHGLLLVLKTSREKGVKENVAMVREFFSKAITKVGATTFPR